MKCDQLDLIPLDRRIPIPKKEAKEGTGRRELYSAQRQNNTLAAGESIV
jgi:hypothetical protein